MQLKIHRFASLCSQKKAHRLSLIDTVKESLKHLSRVSSIGLLMHEVFCDNSIYIVMLVTICEVNMKDIEKPCSAKKFLQNVKPIV